MKLINRVFGFSTRDLYLVEILTFYEKKHVDFRRIKVYYKPNNTFRVVREKRDANGTYYKDLIGGSKYKDLYNPNNYVGDIVATKTMTFNKKKRIKYKDVITFNDSFDKSIKELVKH